jgi:hypothetical protein
MPTGLRGCRAGVKGEGGDGENVDSARQAAAAPHEGRFANTQPEHTGFHHRSFWLPTVTESIVLPPECGAFGWIIRLHEYIDPMRTERGLCCASSANTTRLT